MGRISRHAARRRALRAQRMADEQARNKMFDDLFLQIELIQSQWATPEQRERTERFRATRQAAQDLDEQATEFQRYTLEYRERFFPGQSALSIAVRRKKMTPERLYAAEYEWLPRAARWELLATILRDRVRVMESDYPLIDVSRHRSQSLTQEKMAKVEVKIIARVVQKGGKEIAEQQRKTSRESERICTVM